MGVSRRQPPGGSRLRAGCEVAIVDLNHMLEVRAEPMTKALILQPLFGLAGLTFLVWIRALWVRYAALRQGLLNLGDLRLAPGPHAPEAVSAPARNLASLFELPVLFYVAVLYLYVSGGADSLSLGLCWTFVGARVVHSIIHCTYNNVIHRFAAYAVGCVALWWLWLHLAVAAL